MVRISYQSNLALGKIWKVKMFLFFKKKVVMQKTKIIKIMVIFLSRSEKMNKPTVSNGQEISHK